MSIFVSFEGVDGCGKTTQVELLRSRMESADARGVATREPGGTALAEMLRASILTGEVRIDARAEALLFGAARAQHVVETIGPALERGEIVLCDRFADSSVAYQGAGLGLATSFIAQLNRFATEGLQPHITFLLDIDPAIGWQRREMQRGTTSYQTPLESNAATASQVAVTSRNESAAQTKVEPGAQKTQQVEDASQTQATWQATIAQAEVAQAEVAQAEVAKAAVAKAEVAQTAIARAATARGEEDRIERRGLEFQQRVRAAFLQLAREDPDRIVVLDASVPAKIVHNRIVRELEKRELFQFERR